MIIPNGTIEVKQVVGGGINPITGFPTPAQGEWSGRIACQYSAKAYKHAARIEGEFYTQASYDILVDYLSFEEIIEPTIIRLWDKNGQEVGEFPIIRIEALDAVRQYRITV